jgi:flagellar basal body P-ring formation protein FlgA
MSRDRLGHFFYVLAVLFLLVPCVASGRTSAEEEIVGFIKAMYPDDRVQVIFGQMPQQIKEKTIIKNISFTKVPDASGDGICLVGIESKNGASSSVYVPFKALVERTLFVVRHNIRKGTVMSSADITEKQTYLRGSAALYPERPEDVIGKVVKKELSAGDIIVKQLLEDQVTISRGEVVNVTFENERMLVQAKGTALEKGRIGDVIKVRSPSGKEVSGRVSGGMSVSVEH